MENDNEFVFKRRRKRPRVDAQDAKGPVYLHAGNIAGSHSESRLIPEIATLPEPVTSSPAFIDNPNPPSPSSPPENVVTVEKFLAGSVQTSRTKRMALKPPRTYRYSRRRAEEGRSIPVGKITKASKQAKEPSRIAKTLFRAAVLTGGDPLDTLVEDAGGSVTRRPLKFVPFNKFAGPFARDQTDSDAVEPSAPGRGKDGMQHSSTRHLCDHLDIKAHNRHSSSAHPRMPLSWIPLQEAEAAYSAMFP